MESKAHCQCWCNYHQSQKGETGVLRCNYKDDLRALITKMCWEGELPMRRSSTIAPVPKSTHYENWTRLPNFFALPSNLKSSSGTKLWILQPTVQPRNTSALSTLSLSLSFALFLLSCILCVLLIGYDINLLKLFVCVRVCVNSRGRSSENDSVSAADRNSNPLIWSSASPASQLSRSLWHPPRPLAPCPRPLKIATRETESYFQRKTRDERRGEHGWWRKSVMRSERV